MTVVASKPRTRKLQPSQPVPPIPEPLAAPRAVSSWASLVRGPDEENTPPKFTITTDPPDAEMKCMEPTPLPLGASAPIEAELPPLQGPSEEFGRQRFRVIGEGKKVRRCADCTKPLCPSQIGPFCTSCEASAAAPQGRYIPPSRRRGTYSTGTGMELPATVRLTNLGDATEHDVRDVMATFGSVTRVSVPRDHVGCGRGFAFVTFRAASAAHAVLSARLCMDHLIWHAELSEDKPWTPY